MFKAIICIIICILCKFPPIFSTNDYEGDSERPSNHGCDVCGAPNSPPANSFQAGKKIMNGKRLNNLAKYPWIVNLIDEEDNQFVFCGGVIISPSFILTAAHCLEDVEKTKDIKCQETDALDECFVKPSRITVSVPYDRKDMVEKKVKRLIPHPNYDLVTKVHDIALIQLQDPLRCRKMVSPICLPNKRLDRVGMQLIIAGWGLYDKRRKDTKEKLHEGKVIQVNERKCRYPESRERLIICAGGMETDQASCQGDSGSAIFKKFGENFFVLGITERFTQAQFWLRRNMLHNEFDCKCLTWETLLENHLK
ncbi:transmembrane protease serine 2 [Nephila pilipes]|uniref:Transmembrane protease serine 2 n=1 Tax=Nephila pilipes TaxID=299642 RepID=A0A8X6MN09_NEPPI|nr:transmembrane protease serine 2 [Nephila pilipes]